MAERSAAFGRRGGRGVECRSQLAPRRAGSEEIFPQNKLNQALQRSTLKLAQGTRRVASRRAGTTRAFIRQNETTQRRSWYPKRGGRDPAPGGG